MTLTALPPAPATTDVSAAYRAAFLASYVECAEWSSNHTYSAGEDGEEEGDTVQIDSLHLAWSDAAKATAAATCSTFIDANVGDLANLDAGQCGHDLWLTAQGHGSGFWSRGLEDVGDRLTVAAGLMPQAQRGELYVGDDNLLYLS